MRLTRINGILLVLLAALLALDLGLRDSGPEARTIGRLAPAFYRDRADRALLQRGEGRIELQLTAEGNWILPEHHGYPASSRTLDELLTAMTSLTTLDLVSLDASTHHEYGLDDQALRIEIWDADGQRVLGLLQGEEAAGGGASYVRLMGEAAVYRAARLRSIRLDPGLWLDVQWLTFPEPLVSRISLSGSELSAARILVRDPDTVDTWRIEGGERIGSTAIKGHLRALRGLFVERVQGRADGPIASEQILLSVDLELIDGRKFGAKILGPSSGGPGMVGRRGDEDPFLAVFPVGSWNTLLASAQKLLQ